MAALPTFLPLSEAARKYGLEEAHLRALVEKGKIRAGVVAGEVVVSEEEVQKRAEQEQPGVKKEDLPEYSEFKHLKGKKINIRKASEAYSIPFSTLRGWVIKGIVKKLEVTERDVFLDEADVAYCSRIYNQWC